jgi:hypothetical protein
MQAGDGFHFRRLPYLAVLLYIAKVLLFRLAYRFAMHDFFADGN